MTTSYDCFDYVKETVAYADLLPGCVKKEDVGENDGYGMCCYDGGTEDCSS